MSRASLENFGRLAKVIATSAYRNPPSFELSMRNTPFWDPEKDAHGQTEAARRAFLADAFKGCSRFAEMVEKARSGN